MNKLIRIVVAALVFLLLPVGSAQSVTLTTNKLIVFGFDNSEMAARGYTVEAGMFTPLPGVLPVSNSNSSYGVRDPSLAKVENTYFMAATKPVKSNYLGTGATAIQLFQSPNLADWASIADVPVGVSGATRAWAPDLLVDSSGVFLYYAVTTDPTENASVISSFDIYVRQAQNSALTAWAPPSRITNLASTRTIDPEVVKVNDTRGAYVMFYKAEDTGQIYRAWSNSPLGIWVTDRTGNWLIGSGVAEGPELTQNPDGSWRIFYDRYAENRLVYRDSPDLDNWGPETSLTYSPPGLRHLGSIPVADKDWQTLLSRPKVMRVYVGSVTIPNNQLTAVPFVIPQGYSDVWSAGQPSRLVAPVSGWYQLTYTFGWVPNPNGQRSTAFKINNGVPQYRDSRNATGGGMGTEQGGGDTVYLSAGDYLTLLALQTSGTSLSTAAVATLQLVD